MKKTVSILMALLIALTAMFSITASAEENRSVKFIKDLVKTKTVSVTLGDSLAGGIIKDITANVKLGDSVQVAGKAKVVGINVKLYAQGKDITAYFAIFKINVAKLADININLDEIGEQINPILDQADTILEYLEYKPELSSTNEDVLGLNNDKMAEMIIAQAKENGCDIKAEDLKGKSVAEICELAGITDESTINYYTNLEKSAAHFYYKDGKLTGVKIVMADAETGALNTVIDTASLGYNIKSISTNIPDSTFKKPSFGIDITGLVKIIMNKIMSSMG